MAAGKKKATAKKKAGSRRKTSGSNAPDGQVTCRALILIGGDDIRRKLNAQRKRIERNVGKLQEQLRVYEEEERPAYHRWMHLISGPARSTLNEAQSEWGRIYYVVSMLRNHRAVTGIRQHEQMRQIIFDATDRLGKSVDDLRQMALEDWFDPIVNYVQRQFDHIQALHGDRHDAYDDEDDEDYWDIDDDDDWDSDDDADPFIRFLRDVFGFDDDDIDAIDPYILYGDYPQESEEDNARRARELYHELCRKLHPDAGGEMTHRRRLLWSRLQEAYKEKDLEALETIFAEVELGGSDQNAHQMAPSRLMNMVEYLKKSLRSMRELVRRCKSEPDWGFSTWSDKKQAQARDRILQEMEEQSRECRGLWNKEARLLKSAITRALNRRQQEEARNLEKQRHREELAAQKKRERELQAKRDEAESAFQQTEFLF